MIYHSYYNLLNIYIYSKYNYLFMNNIIFYKAFYFSDS